MNAGNRPALRTLIARLSLAAGAALLSLSVSSPSTIAAPAPADDARLADDPRLLQGELPNGMRYVIDNHVNPAGRVSVWLHISSGSLNETDAQRGIAHYLEHMAFNGSENFPPGSVVPFFESLGLTFGQHQNAFTSFDQTVYQLALPDNKPETLDRALTFMGDVATKLAILPEEIEKERDIILEEKRSRLGARQRIQDIVFKRIAPGSTFGERLPIGVEETIKGVKQADFKDYYSTYYVPSNMTVIVVGDIDQKLAAAAIAKKLGGGDRKTPPQDRPVGVTAAATATAVVVQDKELTRAGVSMIRITPARPPITTKPLVRSDMIETCASFAFNRRLQEKINEGKVAFTSGGGGVSSLFRSMVMAQAQANGEGAKWRQIVTDLASEVQRARKFGFTEDELADVKKEVLSSAEERAKQEDTYDARAILGSINSALAQGEPLRSAAQDLELVKELLPTITASELGAAFSAMLDPAGFVYVLELPAAIEAPSEAEFLKIAQTAMDADVQAEGRSARAEKLLDKTPAPGAITDSSEHAASGVNSAWLSNGIRVHHRFMEVEKNSVAVTITLLGGQLHETAENRGVTSAAINAWQRPATSKLSSTQIRDLMLGRKSQVNGLGGQDSIRLFITGDPADLESGLQLAHLLLTDPKIEEAAFTQWRANQIQQIEGSDKNPQQYFRKAVARTIYPATEARALPLLKEQVEKVTLDQAQAWLKKLIAESPIEISIVGDIKKETVMPLIQTYIGSISNRTRISADSFAKLREIQRPKGPLVSEKELATSTPMAMVLSGFFGPDSINVPDVRALSMADRVMSTRMNKAIREEAQLVYSIGASLQPGGTYRGYGMFLAAAPTEPAKVPALSAKIKEMYDQFAANGITPEELDVARKQAKNSVDEEQKKPGYWGAVLDLMTYDQTKLDDIIAEPTAYDAISADQIVQTFRKYYKPENTVQIVVKPAPAPETQSTETPPAKK